MMNPHVIKLWKIMKELDSWKKYQHAWGSGDIKRDVGLNPHPKDITRYDNLQYGTDKRHNLLDVYKPTKLKNQELPLIINMHGGGFIYGWRKTYQFYCMHLAQAGFAVVNYGYHLAPIYPFPAAWNDTKSAVNWCIKNAKRYGFDLSQVFVVGDSAGGTLAEEYLTLYNNSEAAKKFHFIKPKLKILASAWNCGAFFMGSIPKKIDTVKRFYCNSKDFKKYHEFLFKLDHYIRAPFTPLFIATANHDIMHDQTIRMHQLLIDKGIKHEFKVYGNDAHPRSHDFQEDQKDPIVAQACYKDEIHFFKHFIK